MSRLLGIGTLLFLNGLAWLAGSPVSAAATCVGGPCGSAYDFELMTGEHASGSNHLDRISNGPGSFTLHFDGISESLPSYCCGLDTTPLVTESFTANGDGTSTVEIIATSPDGSDLYPSGLLGPGNVPQTDGALRIGYYSGSIPLTWNPPHTILSATVDLLSNGASVFGRPAKLNPAIFFGAPGPWDGNLLLIFPNQVGKGVTTVDLRIIVPTPNSEGACVADATTLCLSSGRFRVEATWEKVSGEKGSGHAVGLTTDTGYFWFFSESNVEAVIKILDACAFNGKFWVFAAGLTNVQTTITVTDSLTNTSRVYTNPLNTPFQPIQDTAAFATCGARSATNQQSPPIVSSPLSTQSTSAQPDLLLRGGRFLVHAVWTKPTGETGIGTGVALTGDTGYFWFFSSSNVELILKVLDGCALNRRNWVFAGGLTDVKVVVTVTDTLYGETETFTNPQGTAFIPIQRTQTGLISATCLPKCSERSFTPAVITQAVDNAVAGLHAPFSDDFGRAMARISDQLQCGLLDEAAASLGRSSGGLHEGRVALPKTDPIYDPSVDYCGKGDSSTGSLAVAFTGDTYVNQACHDHDLCYQQHCIATICYFCPQSYDAAVCDQPLSYACRNKPHLNIFDHIVCKLVQDIPKIQPFGLLCSGPSCTNGQVCNQQSGQCEGRCSNSIFPTSESFGASSVAGKVSVIAAAGCRWTAESNDNWITIVSGSRDPATGGSNVASGAVLYVLEANLGSEARTGTMYIADRTFRVTQAGSSSS